MGTNNSSTILFGGLAAFGLALVIAGVGLYRRRAGSAAEPAGAAGAVSSEGAAGSQQGEPQAGAGARAREQDPVEDPEPHKNPHPNAPEKKLPLDYFVLVVALTIPFWLFGGKPLPIPIKLPASALALVVPSAAALILTYRRDGFMGIRSLLKRAWDYKNIRNKVWYLPILLLSPVIMVLSYAVMRLAGLPLPDPQIPWIMAPVFFLAFFFAAIAEELGWMGYAFDPMQDRWGALKASLLLGLFWALYHLVPDMQNGQSADWILWHRVGTILSRILMAWLYNNTGKSVFSVLLFHTMNNMGWALFPNYGSHYDPFVTSMITLPVVAMAILAWGPKTLARYRFSRSGRSESRNGQEQVTP